MRVRGVAAHARRFLGAMTCCTAAVIAAQELPEIVETVEVRVVNVDVVVTDASGRPVTGLEREDFELEVNGRPQPLDYFSVVVDGSTVGVEPEEISPAELPYLAIVYNGRGMSPTRARQAVDTLANGLDGLLAKTSAVMVVRQATGLVVEQRLTRNRELLAAALDRLTAAPPPLEAGDRKMLMLQLENTSPPQVGRQADPEMAEFQEAMAEVAARQLADLLLHQVRVQAQLERAAADEANRQLRSVVRSLAGLPGRKAILLLGEGFSQQPGDAMFRLWWSKFGGYASDLGASSIQAELGRVRGDRLLAALVEEANAQRVSIYSHDPTGMRIFGGSAEYGSPESNLEVAQETERMMDSLVDLSLATGGISRVDARGLEPLLDEMLDGFASYYSLGFDPGETERGRVRVRLRRPGLRARYLERFSVHGAAQQLEAATLATLLVTEKADNRLDAAIELGRAEKEKDGSFLVPLLIKVPLSRIALLPRRASHIGRLSFVVIAQDASGGLSPPATGEVPIEIGNQELLTVIGRVAGYRLKLRMRGGEHTVAIGVRDEVAGEDSTLRLALTPDRLTNRRSADRL